MSEKFCFGNIELIIAHGDGIYHVLDSQTEYNVIHTGTYEECLEFCEREKIISEVAICATN